jgi:hypothetical protein
MGEVEQKVARQIHSLEVGDSISSLATKPQASSTRKRLFRWDVAQGRCVRYTGKERNPLT